MPAVTGGELWGYRAPVETETIEVPIVLTDANGAKVAGVAWNAAGMAVTYRKEGVHAFAAFPTFDANNWAECGNGEYVIIMRQSDAAELALMDTEGTLTFYVVCDATAGDFAKIKVNPADVARDDVWTDARAALIDEIHTDILHIPAYTGDIWYVSMGGNDANDGDHPEAAFLTVGHAIGAAAAGDRIVVKAGTYVETGLDMNLAGLELVAEHGTILSGGGTGTCLVVSASYCEVSGFLFVPGAAEVGLDVEVAAIRVTVRNCMAYGASVGFDIHGLQTTLYDCVSTVHTVTGFDIAGASGIYRHCTAQGAAAVRGFYLSANTADANELTKCHALGNTTAGFEVVVGADGNCFALCSSGGGDGARVDNGVDNSWAGYAILPSLVPDDLTGGGVNACPLTYTDSDTNVAANVPITCWNEAETAVIATVTTNSSGVATFHLNDGTYHFLSPSTALYDATNNALVVAGPTPAAYEIPLNVIPVPDDPTVCRCFAFMDEIEGAVDVGEGEGTLDVIRVVSRPVGSTPVYAVGTVPALTNAEGFVYIDVVRGARVSFKGTWPGVVLDVEKTIEVLVPDGATYDLGPFLQP